MPACKLGISRGRPGSDQELATITSQLMRRMSAATLHANFTCHRIAQVEEVAKRRDWVRW